MLNVLITVGKNNSCATKTENFSYCKTKIIWHEDIVCDDVDDQGCKQLQLAYYRDVERINMNQDLNYPISKHNWTLLMIASHQGHLTLVRELINHGSKKSINNQDKCGWSALMFAAFTGASIEVVRLLLEHGADINLVNQHDRNALFLASGKGHVEIVKLLLEKGANTRHEDIWGIPPITWSVYSCGVCQPDVVRAILYHCDNDREHLHGALWAAAYDYCCPEIVDDLIMFGAPIDDIDQMVQMSNHKCKDCAKDCEVVGAKLQLTLNQPTSQKLDKCTGGTQGELLLGGDLSGCLHNFYM